MFAVPGWNLPAKSLVQEQVKPVKDKSNSDSIVTSQLDRNGSTNPRKRKQKHSEGSHEQWNSDLKDKQRKTLLDSQSYEAKDGSSDRHGKYRSRPQAEPKGSSVDPPTNALKPQSAKDAKLPKDSAKPTRRPHSAQHLAKDDVDARPLPPIPPTPQNLTPLQAKMRAKLTSARFRHLNETLYTTSSIDAMTLFANSPDLFTEYHAGFAQQVKDSWPRNPVDTYVKHIKFRAGIRSPVNNIAPLARRRPGVCTIVDLGCGDAPLARGLQNVAKKLNLKLESFDLHAPNPHVTVADISALPLRDGDADLAIFCLSLMGTNWLTFVEEAWRVLRGDGKGEVWVAEVKSRFGRLSAKKSAGRVVENSVGKRRKGPAGKGTQHDENDAVENRGLAETDGDAPGLEDDTDLQPFIDSFQRRGFMIKEGSVDKTNKMFVTMIFTKTGVPRAGRWKGMKWDGKEYRQIEDPRFTHYKKFQVEQRLPTEDEIDETEEGKLLKPCVYKQR